MLAGATHHRGGARRRRQPARATRPDLCAMAEPVPVEQLTPDAGGAPSWSGSRPRSPITTAATTATTRPRSRMPSTTRCAGATRRSRRAFPSWSAPTARASGRRAAGRGLRQGAPSGADALARQRHGRRRRWSSSCAASRRFLSLGRGRAARPGGRAQDRRAVVEPALRGRPAGAGRHARRRHRRRGRDREPAHDPRHPAAPARASGRRRCWRCAARSTWSARTSWR